MNRFTPAEQAPEQGATLKELALMSRRTHGVTRIKIFGKSPEVYGGPLHDV